MNKLNLMFKQCDKFALVMPRFMDDFMIDDVFASIVPDIVSRKIFIEQLKTPLIDKNDIIYRQELIYEFINCPTLFEQFKDVVKKIQAFQKECRESNKTNANLYSYDELARFRSIVQIKAITLEKLIFLIFAMKKVLKDYTPCSKALSDFKSILNTLFADSLLNDILEVCNTYENIQLNKIFNIYIKLNLRASVECCVLLSVDEKNKSNQAKMLKKAYLSPSVKSEILLTAFRNISDFFSKTTSVIIDSFSDLYNQVIFYDVCLRYYYFFKKLGKKLIFPTFESNKDIVFDDLYDLKLATQFSTISNIIPNNFHMNSNGIIVFGKNGNGKTVYLRSIAIAQLLSQSGLPILASKASTHVFLEFCSHCVGKENDIANMGRFEQEVVQFSQIVENASSESFVLMNEPFQSTEYNEGAEGLINILEYFKHKKIQWIIVSHLHKLEEHFHNSEVKILHAGEDHKII